MMSLVHSKLVKKQNKTKQNQNQNKHEYSVLIPQKFACITRHCQCNTAWFHTPITIVIKESSQFKKKPKRITIDGEHYTRQNHSKPTNQKDKKRF